MSNQQALCVALAVVCGASGPSPAFIRPPPSLSLTSPGISATFDSGVAGVRLDRGAGEGERLQLGVAAIGRVGAMRAAHAHPAHAEGTDVVLDVGLAGAQEWWRALPSGLEHGVTIADPPSGPGALLVDIHLDGLAAREIDDENVGLVDALGRCVARYGELVVLDARGGRVPARLAAIEHGLRVEIDDSGASYPLVVDPLLATEQASLAPPGGVTNGGYGTAVAMSADGMYVFVGEPRATSPVALAAGRVVVLQRVALGWRAQAVLYASDGEGGDSFGASIAVTADASTVVIGAPTDKVGAIAPGSVRTFTRSGTTWTEVTTATWPGTDDLGRFGGSVAIASDASRMVVGAENMDTSAGTTSGQALALVWTGGGWMQEALFQPTDLATGDHFGFSVALDAAGTVAAIGAARDNTPGGNDAGSVRVYRRSGTSWTPEAAPLLDPAPAMGDMFGSALSFDASGTLLAVGIPYDAATGAVVLFRFAASAWTADATLGGVGASEQLGSSVALTPDGAHLVAGGPSQFASPPGGGVLRTYDHGTSWTAGPVLTYAGGLGADQLGRSVAISSSGGLVIAGAPGVDIAGVGTNAGGAVVFTKTGSSWDAGVAVGPEGGTDGDVFGTSVALSSDGTRAVVGAPGENAAYVFLRTASAWALDARLAPPAPTGYTWSDMAASVAISSDGTIVVLGSPNSDTPVGSDAGQIVVFGHDAGGWTSLAFVGAQGAAPYDQFGASVAVSADGSRIVVGAPSDTTPLGLGSGSARVLFRSSTNVWSEEAILLSGVTQGSVSFGASVAITDDGATALVGSPFENRASLTDVGGARIFTRSGTTWSAPTLITPSAAPAYALYGTSVALSAGGGRALVGSIDVRASTTPTGPGHVGVFSFVGGAWTEEALLALPAGVTGDRFGAAVALSGDGNRALVGAPLTAVGGTVGLYLRTAAGTWSTETALQPAELQVGSLHGSSVAWSRSGSVALLGRPQAYTPIAVYRGAAHVFSVVGADGDACADATACASGFCVDGVCCAGGCGGGVADCQACSVAAGGSMDGTCTALTSPVVCRAAIGDCDLPESCSSSSTVCPADARLSAGTVCRAASPLFACDAAEVCDGTSGVCPADTAARTDTICRVPVGACDAEERCDGTSFACPGDAVVPPGIACGGSGPGSCSTLGTCDGISTSCPGAMIFAAGTPCLRRDPLNPCDLDDFCDGVHDSCPPTYAPAGTVCAPAFGDLCDAPDLCAGSSADCIPTFATGVVCRAAAGPCDVAESCSGTAASCPPDALLATGAPCRDATQSCDTPEVCDGTASTCPPDMTSCMDSGMADGGNGADAGSATSPDAALANDAGAVAPPIAGCGCVVGAPAARPWMATTSLALVLPALRWRRRRRPPHS